MFHLLCFMENIHTLQLYVSPNKNIMTHQPKQNQLTKAINFNAKAFLYFKNFYLDNRIIYKLSSKSWVFAFILFISFTHAKAQNVYVSTGGNNLSNDGSISSPWRTIQYAIDHVNAGQTINVRAGIYSEKVMFSGSNDSGSSSGGYVTLQNYSGETVIMDGAGLNPSEREGMVSVKNASYIKIDGFEIRNFNINNNADTPIGIYVEGASHHIEILNNKIHHIISTGSSGGAHGIGIFGINSSTAIHTLTIDNNEIFNCTLRWSEAMVLNGNVRNFIVSNNSVHDVDNIAYDFIGFEGECASCGTSNYNNLDQARDGEVYSNIAYNIDTKDNPVYNNVRSAAGFYVDGGIDIVFDGNISHHNNLGFELASEKSGKSTSNITVRNNFIYKNHIAGIATGGYENSVGKAENCKVVNNTFYQNNNSNRSIDNWGAEILLQSNNHNNTYKNNIIYADANRPRVVIGGSQNGGNTGNQFDYNLYFGSSAGVAPGNNSITGNPSLTNPDNGDLHISLSSIALNAGSNLGINIIGDSDIDGDIRVSNGAVDMGADESGGVTIPNNPSNGSASAISSSQIDLSWNDNSNNEDNFQIQHSPTGNGDWTQIAIVNANTTNYSNTGLNANTTYHYRVRARNSAGNSNWSNTTLATTQPGGSSSFITIDGNTSDWNGISVLASESGQHLTILKATNDETHLYILLQGSNISTYTQVFINSDNNTNTGYHSPSWSSSGADYMIENNELYKSTGNNAGWNWSYQGTAGILYAKNSNVVEISIEKTKINPSSTISISASDLNSSWNNTSNIPSSGGLPSFTLSTTSIVIDGSASDWESISSIANESSQHLTTMKVTDDPTHLYILLQGSNISTQTEIFINSDNNTNTGHQSSIWSSSGADYMIENSELYQSTSNNSNWNWQYKGTTGIEYAKNSNVVEVSIEKAKITPNATIRISASELSSNWNVLSNIPSSGALPAYLMNSSNAKQVAISETKVNGKEYIIYPNPNQGAFNIKLTEKAASIASVTIRNMFGKKILYKEHKTSTKKDQYSLPNLKSGLYKVLIKTDRGIIISKTLFIVH